MNYKSSKFQITISTRIIFFVVFFCSLFSPKFLLSQKIENVEDIYISGGAQIVIQSDEALIVLNAKNHHPKKGISAISISAKKDNSQKKSGKLIKEEEFDEIETVKEKPEIFFVGTSSPNSFRISHKTNDFVFNNFQNYQSAKQISFFYALFSNFKKEKKINSLEVFFLNALHFHSFYSRPPPSVSLT